MIWLFPIIVLHLTIELDEQVPTYSASRTSDLGADTLTPGDTCLKYVNDVELGHDNGYTQLSAFRSIYLPSIVTRLRKGNPAMTFTTSEVYSMQEMCGFEILVRGSSPWCNVFTQED